MVDAIAEAEGISLSSVSFKALLGKGFICFKFIIYFKFVPSYLDNFVSERCITKMLLSRLMLCLVPYLCDSQLFVKLAIYVVFVLFLYLVYMFWFKVLCDLL